ncbi:MBF2 protein [Danaus plexippus plexippus]|uniref:MBF2 protein n=2 Tax=Danaus plexippus plexippus TaxID=278856 RepID=A0A212EUP2_DANPL|nr:uncharacterized protein LOC116768154 isoform X2 [Danaus plexippus plexippus]OWR45174.1 MBF2 protein [Danaus plexippus plexippus]
MRLAILTVFVAAIFVVHCSHVFMGTSVQRPLVYHREVKYNSQMFRKRIEYFNFTLPSNGFARPAIQGILAFDLLKSTASANVTSGGIGYSFVNLRMKSERGKKLDYDIYIFA